MSSTVRYEEGSHSSSSYREDSAPRATRSRRSAPSQEETTSCGEIVAMVGMISTIGLALLPAFGSQITAKICKDIHEDEDISKANLAWAYPLNGIVNLLAVALQPVGTLIAFVAATIFGIAGMLTYCFEDLRDVCFGLSGVFFIFAANIRYIPVLLARTVYPVYQYEEIKQALKS